MPSDKQNGVYYQLFTDKLTFLNSFEYISDSDKVELLESYYNLLDDRRAFGYQWLADKALIMLKRVLADNNLIQFSTI